MRIAVNGCSFSKKQYTGIGRYAFNLVRVLADIDRENEYRVYYRKKFFDRKRQTPRIRSPRLEFRRDFWGRGVARTIADVDLYHAPSPEDLPEIKAKVVVTVHDLIFKTFPRGHTPQTIATAERQTAALVKRADRIICCSRSTADDLKKYYAVPEQKMALVYQGVDKTVFYPLDESETAAARDALRPHGIDRPYLLFVGTLEPRKNLNAILAAFKKIKDKNAFPGQLVVVGMKGWMSQDLNGQVSRLGVAQDVVELGYVPDDLLRCLYNCANAFVFPSYYEGFGFPVLEAFSCGTPVITSNVSSCGELAADAALTVAPDDIDGLAGALKRLAGDDQLCRDLRRKGLARAGEFSFLQTARQTLKLYESLM